LPATCLLSASNASVSSIVIGRSIMFAPLVG